MKKFGIVGMLLILSLLLAACSSNNGSSSYDSGDDSGSDSWEVQTDAAAEGEIGTAAPTATSTAGDKKAHIIKTPLHTGLLPVYYDLAEKQDWRKILNILRKKCLQNKAGYGIIFR